jgi:ATP-binding cassette, subfamily B (MDR/TAP), member 1
MKLPISWYHLTPLHSAFKTNKSLTYNPVIVNSLLTNFYSIILKCLSSYVTGIIIAFIYEWRLALLGFIVLPMMMLSGYLSVVFYRGSLNLYDKDYLDSTSVLSEAIANIRSVQSETYNQVVLEKYRSKLIEPLKKAKIRANISSAIFGLSQLLIFVSYTIMFYFGAQFFKNNREITALDLLTAIFAVIWSGWTSGANFIRLPDKTLCRKAAAYLFFILDEHDENDLQIL